MASAQTRTAKGKVAPKTALPSKTVARAPVASTTAKKGNSEQHLGSGPTLNAEERNRLVAQAAYFRAEKRGFAPGCELQDWIEAEAEVLRLIGGA